MSICQPRWCRSVAGKARRKIKIGTVYPATINLLPAFLARIGRKYPDIELHIMSGSTNDIIRGLENGKINLGFIRPVENIGSLRFFSIAHERYLLAVEKTSALLARSEIGIEDLGRRSSRSRCRTCHIPIDISRRSSRSTICRRASPIPATTPSRWCPWSRPALASALLRNGRWICRTAISS
jgi:DNA-binding transcriptional LysR family regulator